MLRRIIERHSKIDPLSDTEIQIIRGATKLFLQQGFSKTTIREISKETGIGLGTITYYYRTKEDLLKLLIEELMEFHFDIIEEAIEKTNDNIFSCAFEVAVQIALCENDSKAWDLYYSAYSHPSIFEFIKDWAAKKNYHLLKDNFPDMTEDDFRRIENVSSGIELAAFLSPCSRYFTLDEKISLFLESIMKIFNVQEDKRREIVDKVLALDYQKTAGEIFERFINKVYSSFKNTSV
ncbi:MAG: TetR/AcrR family transcriptional regulator [Ruminococcaceae bacterium]|nr:TetR/AcrR family transcriptional regulator [Oscillospiraceae bacterium]